MKQPNRGKWLDDGPVGSIHPTNSAFLWKKAVDARHKAGHDEHERS
jgi:hypothetical protein